jgi:hypothetical protein
MVQHLFTYSNTAIIKIQLLLVLSPSSNVMWGGGLDKNPADFMFIHSFISR